MSTSQSSRSGSLLDCTNRRDLAHGPSVAPYPDNAATFSSHAQDPFTYYKAYLDTTVSSNWSAWGVNDHMNAFHADSRNDPTAHYAGDQRQARVRPVPHHGDVRFTHPSNGPPLPTITEQGSYSTLKSSVGGYSSLKFIDRNPTNQHPHGAPRNLHETILFKIDDNTHRVQHFGEDVALPARLEDDDRTLDLQHTAASPIRANPREHRPSQISQTPYTANELESGGLKGVLRQMLHNIRDASRHDGWSRPSMTNTPHADFQGEDAYRAQPGEGSFPGTLVERNAMWASTYGNSLPLGFSAPPQHPARSEARSRTSLSIDTGSEARIYPRLLHLPPTACEFDAESSSFDLLQPPPSSSSPSEPVESMIPREWLREHTISETCTLSDRSRDNLSTRYTFDGVPLFRTNAPSLREYDRAREASICSTISTTYSGAVLGIDLDLKREDPLVARRSPTPEWFALRQTSGSNAIQKQNATRQPHSITSSALPVLLPLAAASGIVHPNHTTRRISFVSPSGNLIQAEDSSSPTPTPTPPPRPNHPPTTSTYQTILSRSPPIRPAPLPLKPPLPSTSPLPPHLRPHHPNPHPSPTTPAQPQTHPKITIKTTPKVLGCNGIITPPSPHPQTKPPPSPCTAPPSSSLPPPHKPIYRPANLEPSCAIPVATPRDRSRRLERGVGFALRGCFCRTGDGMVGIL